MSAVGRFGPQSVTVIPQSLDTYVSISVNRCRYLDFRRFLKAPLNDLVETLRLKSGTETFVFTKQHVAGELMDTVVKKQVFCSDYIDSVERLRETNLPAIGAFYDRVNDVHISKAEYDHAKQLWTVFGITSLEDYLRHYLTIQSLLFADVLENFRDMMLRDFHLDVLHYFSLPGFSWDACLFQSGVTLELITCEEMHAVILNGIRGKLMISLRRKKRCLQS